MVYKAVTSIPDPSLTKDVYETAPGVMATLWEVMERFYQEELQYALEHWQLIDKEDDIYKIFGRGLWDGESQYIVG